MTIIFVIIQCKSERPMPTGDWNGNACRNFLGVGSSVTCKDYTHVIARLLTLIEGKDNETELRKFLEDAFTPLCEQLAEVALFLRHPVFPKTEKGQAGLEAGIAACTGYVEFFRRHLTNNQYPFLGTVNVTIKMHVLETHVPQFARRWRVIGLFGEDAIETMHKVINEHRRRLAAVKDPLMQMQCSDDRLNSDMLVACKHAHKRGWKGPARRRLKREHAHYATEHEALLAHNKIKRREIILTLD